MYKKIIAILSCLILALSVFTSCTGQATSKTTTSKASSQSATSANQAVALATSGDMFTSRDLEIGYDEGTSTVITLSGTTATASGQGATIKENAVEITADGTYILRGEFTGQIIINAQNTDKIQIVLDNAQINNSQSPAIYVKQADKVFVTLADNSTNSLSVTGEYLPDGDTNTDAALFSKDDLTLNGNGVLTINSELGNGITSKDDLVIAGGNYTITAGGHGIEGKDSVRIANGTFKITSVKDGIHAENADDTSLGFVYIENGAFSISADDDGIHAAAANTIAGGAIDIVKSYEGIEGLTIDISGGNINLTSEDDGLNAAGGADGSAMGGRGEFAADANTYIKISGGVINIDASGDGVDSNGNLYVSGGETYVSGPNNSGNGALDFNGTGEITGGIFMATDTGGMAMNFGDTSTQGAILLSAQGTQSGIVTIKNSSGDILASFEPKKSYAAACISVPGIKQGETYTITLGDYSQTVEMTSLIYGQSSGMGGGMRGGMGGGGKGGMQTPPDFNNGEMPNAENMPRQRNAQNNENASQEPIASDSTTNAVI